MTTPQLLEALGVRLISETAAQKTPNLNDSAIATLEALAQVQTLAVTGGTRTLNASERRKFALVATGALTSDQTLTVLEKPYVVVNGTTGNFRLRVQAASGVPLEIAQGAVAFLVWDGANFRAATGDRPDTITLTPVSNACSIPNGSPKIYNVVVSGAATARITLTVPPDARGMHVFNYTNQTLRVVNGNNPTTEFVDIPASNSRTIVSAGDNQGCFLVNA